MLAYAPYGESVLARFARVVLEETTKKPAFALAYGALIERLVKRKCLSCPPSHFRRVLLLAVEDAGVRLLKRQEDVMHRRALETLGWARYQKRLAERAVYGTGDVSGTADATSFYDAVADRESYAEYKAFRDECKALQGILRDLYEHRGVLLPEDMRDVAAGFPGSEHSVGVEKSGGVEKQRARGLARWRSVGRRRRDATRAAAAQISSWHQERGRRERRQAARRQGPEPACAAARRRRRRLGRRRRRRLGGVPRRGRDGRRRRRDRLAVSLSPGPVGEPLRASAWRGGHA